ncbi:MAG: SDR family oxidoreductase [Candidatus Competibacteraceae bacterium]|nr:SDR family oxidoreductase [Candidatus Competibacteraceae bacterium]
MLRDGSLKGKTFVVTGGGTGLGRSMSKYFLELGAQVVICSRKKDVIEEAALTLEKETGGRCLGLPCDVRKYEEVESILQQAVATFGQVNGLVNNAAGNFISPTERLSHRAFDTIVDIVLKGTYNCSLSFGKYWIANNIKANVLNIVTTYSWVGSGYVVPSACAKSGVLALTRSLAVEWGKYGIRFNAIAPGPFPTPGAWDRLFPQDFLDKLEIEQRIPVGRVGEHQELANLAAYLMSDYSAYINGDVITIDGGEWMRNGGEFSWIGDMISPDMWDRVEEMIKSKNSKGSTS